MSFESASIPKIIYFNYYIHPIIRQNKWEKPLKSKKNDKKWQKMIKNDVSTRESNKKISLISFNGVPKYIEIDKVSKKFGISCFKVEKLQNSNTWFF